MSVIRDLLTALGVRGVDAELFNNGGGVMVVRAAFGEWVPDKSNRRYEVLITARDDSFEIYSDDNDMGGLLACLYVNNDEGEHAEVLETCGEIVLYQSSDELLSVNEYMDHEASHPLSCVAMSVEIRECADAVAGIIRAVANADHAGRAGTVVWDPMGGWVD